MSLVVHQLAAEPFIFLAFIHRRMGKSKKPSSISFGFYHLLLSALVLLLSSSPKIWWGINPMKRLLALVYRRWWQNKIRFSFHAKPAPNLSSGQPLLLPLDFFEERKILLLTVGKEKDLFLFFFFANVQLPINKNIWNGLYELLAYRNVQVIWLWTFSANMVTSRYMQIKYLSI